MEQLQADHGTSSPLVAGVGLSVVAVFGGMLVVSIMILAILSTPREKYDWRQLSTDDWIDRALIHGLKKVFQMLKAWIVHP